MPVIAAALAKAPAWLTALALVGAYSLAELARDFLGLGAADARLFGLSPGNILIGFAAALLLLLWLRS